MTLSIACLQPTYEELKPFPARPWYCQHNSLQPTYEELKHICRRGFHGGLCLFTAYLWGIETCPDELQRKNYSLFTAYLWGIETQYMGRTNQWAKLVYSLPMRNWNSVSGTATTFPVTFTAYLWGIETAYDCSSLTSLDVFTAYLWGIETLTSHIHLTTVSSFTAYLWGIETRFSPTLSSSAWRLQPTYEELKRHTSIGLFHGFIPFTAYLWGIETWPGWW